MSIVLCFWISCIILLQMFQGGPSSREEAPEKVADKQAYEDWRPPLSTYIYPEPIRKYAKQFPGYRYLISNSFATKKTCSDYSYKAESSCLEFLNSVCLQNSHAIAKTNANDLNYLFLTFLARIAYAASIANECNECYGYFLC